MTLLFLHRKDRTMLPFLSILAIIASTHAYRQDLAKLPNGNSYGLTLGHPGGNTKVPTKLASSFYAAGQTWNKAFCMADADGDGQSNGLEMGDPCCKWSIGQTPQFTTGLSDPNSAASKTQNTMSSCIMLNAKRSDLGNPGPGVCACNGNIFDVGSCDSADCYNLCDKRGLGHGVCTTKYKASREIQYEEEDTEADVEADAEAVAMDLNANANANANKKLQCAVCTQALQIDLAKPSDNAAEFSLTSVKSCKDATQDDDQKLLCVATLIKNADQLLMDQKNGVTPIQSCMNLGLMCIPTVAPTAVPTKAPTAVPTAAPTAAPSAAPSAAPTAAPTAAPSVPPTKFPTAPPPPRTIHSIQNGTASNAVQTISMIETTTKTTEYDALIPVAISVVAAAISVLIISLAVWSYQKNKQAQTAVLQTNDNDFQALPDIVY